MPNSLADAVLEAEGRIYGRAAKTDRLETIARIDTGGLLRLGTGINGVNVDNLYINDTQVLSTAAELDRVADVSTRLIAAGSALSVTEALHGSKIILLDTAAGSTCTLPASTGSGAIFRFVVSVLATTNNHIVKVANASDIIQGVLSTVDTDTAGTITGWATAGTSDTITLNRSTTGSAMRGEWIEVIDVATNLWLVRGQVANTGAGATPFSATV